MNSIYQKSGIQHSLLHYYSIKERNGRDMYTSSKPKKGGGGDFIHSNQKLQITITFVHPTL